MLGAEQDFFFYGLFFSISFNRSTAAGNTSPILSLNARGHSSRLLNQNKTDYCILGGINYIAYASLFLKMVHTPNALAAINPLFFNSDSSVTNLLPL
jgi:hypothetical protein